MYLNNPDLEPFYLYILSRLPVRRLDIFEHWRAQAGTFEAVYLSSERQLKELGWGYELVLKFREIKNEWSVEKLVNVVEKTNVSMVTYLDTDYPAMLREITDPPPVLFFRGQLNKSEACIAIVGSRKMSNYGLGMIPKIAGPLVNAGVTIVSGLAYGIDSAAHTESVNRQARTIAVLGTGVDEKSIYPRGHLKLAHQILETGGLLISEQPPGTPGLPHHFVARNRIIAGLSLGVIIVECKVKSGALITADYAADFNRNLYAVPGPAYSALSAGPHELIRNGAMLITCGEDVLQDIKLDLAQLPETAKPKPKFSELEQRVLECMQDEPQSATEIIVATNASTEIVMQTITLLELRGAIKEINNKYYKT